MTYPLSTYAFPVGDVAGYVLSGESLVPGTLHCGDTRFTLSERFDQFHSCLNAKDWGATGDGVTNDYEALQGAIDHLYDTVAWWTQYSHGGLLYIPPGVYNLGVGNRLHFSPNYGTWPGYGTISIVGGGRDLTVIKGDFHAGTGVPWSTDPNFLIGSLVFDPGAPELMGTVPHLLEDFTIWNTSQLAGTGAYCCQFAASPQFRMNRMRFIGRLGAYLQATFGGHMENCLFVNSQIVDPVTGAVIFPTADAYIPWQFNQAFTSRGILFGQGVYIHNEAIGFDYGFALAGDYGSGNACLVAGNKATRCKVGFGWGSGSTGVNYGSGSLIVANHAERCQIGHENRVQQGASILGCGATGSEGPSEPATISAMNRVGSTVTVTTQVPHNIPATMAIKLSADLASWFPTGNTTGIVIATPTDGNHFTFTSTNGSSFSGGTWNYPVNAGMYGAAASQLIAGPYLGIDASRPLLPSRAHFDLSNMGAEDPNKAAPSNSVLMAIESPLYQEALAYSQFKMLGCSWSMNNVSVSMLPLAPLYSFYGALSTKSRAVGETYNVLDSTACNFSETIRTYLTTSAPTAIGSHRLNFASVPADIVTGMRITDGLNLWIDYPVHFYPTTVQAVGSNYIDMTGTALMQIDAGAVIIFDRYGGSNYYKTRFNGSKWIRVG